MEDIKDFYAEEIMNESIEFYEKYREIFTLQESIDLIIRTHQLNHQVKVYEYLECINISLEGITDKIDELICNR